MNNATKMITMFTVSLALFMDVLDSNIINTAIPSISRSLAVNPIDLKIALISYLLSMAIFIPASGWFADKYGAKTIFITAIGLFTFSSFWCGYAHDLTSLVIARSFQGIGGAFMLSLGRLIVARTFPKHELVGAMNTVIIVVAIAVMLGPFIGGVITQHMSWPWIFWVNIPAGIITMLLAAYGIKDITPKSTRPFDAIGFVLFGGGLAILLFCLSEMSESKAHFSLLTWMLFTAFLMLVIYIFHAKRFSHPLIKIELFRIRTFKISVLGNLFARLGFGAMPFLLPLMLQIGIGYSAEVSGLLLVPLAFGIIFSKLIALKALRLVGYKQYLQINTLLVALCVWFFQMVDATTSPYVIAALTFILGIFTAAQFTGMNSLAFADVHSDDLSYITSITSTTQILAQSFGIAIGAIFLRVYSSMSSHPGVLTVTTFHETFFAMGIITVLASLIFVGLKTDDGRQMLAKQEDGANKPPPK